jgi:type I restriction enzyme M protein
MLLEIKQLLSQFDDIDIYTGYQIIAEIWKGHLHRDTELIANEGFHKLGRMREPNIVTKGTGNKKREEQDGWNGVLVPNTLIAQFLYTKELKALDDKRNKIQEIDMELAELIEAAKLEDSEENDALVDVIKRTKDDELGDAFDKSALKTELKNETKGTQKYVQLKKVEDLIIKSAALSKEVKADDKALKDAVEERILILTDDEIDTIVYDKWFGTTVDELTGLIQTELKHELNTLEQLNSRYSDTLSDLDKDIKGLLSDFSILMNDLVVK